MGFLYCATVGIIKLHKSHGAYDGDVVSLYELWRKLVKCVFSGSQGLIKPKSRTCQLVVLVILNFYLYFVKKCLNILNRILKVPENNFQICSLEVFTGPFSRIRFSFM